MGCSTSNSVFAVMGSFSLDDGRFVNDVDDLMRKFVSGWWLWHWPGWLLYPRRSTRRSGCLCLVVVIIASPCAFIFLVVILATRREQLVFRRLLLWVSNRLGGSVRLVVWCSCAAEPQMTTVMMGRRMGNVGGGEGGKLLHSNAAAVSEIWQELS